MWDDLEYLRDDMLIEADALEEIALWAMGAEADDESVIDLYDLIEMQEAA
jgi:hypothetical protein